MISFNNADIEFKLKNKIVLKQWIVSIIEKKKCKAGEISFVFCSDEHLLTLNKQYLQHNTYTDIITFDYAADKAAANSKSLKRISGDIFISTDRVIENAKKFSKTIEEELHRVIIHGILHLLGYKDKTKTAKAAMTKQEDECLKALAGMLKRS